MSKTGDFEAVKKDILAVLKQPEYDDGSAGPVPGTRPASYLSRPSRDMDAAGNFAGRGAGARRDPRRRCRRHQRGADGGGAACRRHHL